jgi:hypothetical protein
MTPETVQWIILVLVIVNLLGTGALLARRYPRP